MNIAVAMSGGVDSSVVACLLKEQGHNVFGITMKHLDSIEDGKDRPCCSLEDILDAKVLCSRLGIPHYTVNLKDLFKREIIDHFIREHKYGNTPNPCVRCNQKVKTKELLRYSRQMGADLLATGHYVSIKDNLLHLPNDMDKDQTYFLSQISSQDLKYLHFPLGKLNKKEVRDLARKFNISSSEKPDSQGVCFIRKSYKDFLKDSLGESFNIKGEIRDLEENILGHHDGVHNFTVGQRRGIDISSSEVLYVVSINPMNQIVYVGRESSLFRKEVYIKDINLFVDREDIKGTVLIKTRARDPFVEGLIDFSNESAKITFIKHAKAPTTGQVAAFYSIEGSLLGSGIIFY